MATKFAFTDYGFYEQIVENAGFGVEDMADWAEAKMEMLNGRKEKEAARREAKRLEGDELQAAVLSVLTSEPQKISDIVTAVEAKGFDNVTSHKVVNKLKNLKEAGKVVPSEEKFKVTNDEGKEVSRRLKVYALA